MMVCYCGSGKAFEYCCQPYIQGREVAPTAEALMRSRYSAYVIADINYLMNSHHPTSRPTKERKEILKWTKSVQWIKLEVKKTVAGNQNDTEGWVVFIAYFSEEGKIETIHENSRFVKENGKWFYISGQHQ
nr:YchJ family metal-binding protein [uncultured Carboxylicivirga sp.]